MNASDVERPAVTRGGLSVGVCVKATQVPRWITELLDDLAASVRVRLVWIAVATAPSSEPGHPGRAWRVWHAADRALFQRRTGALVPVDVSTWAHEHGVPLSLTADVPGARPATGSPGNEPQIVLDLRGDHETSPTSSAGRAVWRLHGVAVDGQQVRTAATPVAQAMLEGSPTIAFELTESGPEGTGGCLTRVGVCPVHPSSPRLTDAYLAASARQLIARRIENLTSASVEDVDSAAVQDGPSEASHRPQSRMWPAPVRRPSRGAPISPALAGARVLSRTCARQLSKSVWEPQWFLLIGRQPSSRLLPDPRRLRALFPPAGAYWADPHVVEFGGHVHVFFEEFVYAERRGHIAVISLDSSGRPGPPAVALDLDSHLSYPDVFVHDRRLFMIPEGAASGSVDLYECQGDPGNWAHRRTLLPDTPLVDASIVEWQGRWWLFGSLKKPAGLRTAELLLLFSADDPLTGVWEEHPASPLLADVTNARPAGAPWRRGPHLYRLAQDGSRGYGSGVVVNEILKMDAAGYDERRVALLRPTWGRGLRGVHTLNRCGDVVVMDACRLVFRDPRRLRTDAMLD